MTVIDANPTAFKRAIIKFGADEYQAHVSSAQFNEASKTASWTGLGGETHTDTLSSENVLDLAVVQDWATPTSLCNFLFDNRGEKKEASIEFIDGPTFSATVTLVKPAVGGKVNEFNESTVSLPSSEPVKTAETTP